MIKYCLIGIASLLFCASIRCEYLSADDVVLPNNSFETNPGAYGNTVPFGDPQSDNTFQFQQLYGASLFPLHLKGPISIIGLSVRPENGFSYTGTFSSSHHKIDVSSTPLAELSTVFDFNHGSDRLTVFDGPLTFEYPTTVDPGSQVYDFSNPIIFDTPFTYDPGSGRGLVIHFFEYDENKTGGFYVDRHFDSSWATTGNQWSPDVGSATAYQPVGYMPGQAMIIQLHYLSVPEPSVLTLTLVSLSYLISKCRQDRSRSS